MAMEIIKSLKRLEAKPPRGGFASKSLTFAVLRGKRSVLEEELARLPNERGQATEKVRPWGALLVMKIFKLLTILFTFSFLLLPFIVSAGTIRKPPNNLGLVAYWPMDEGSGTKITDHSGNGRNGTFAGTGTMPSWGNGKRDKALDFSGITTGNGRIGITALNVTNTHTVSMWVYISSNCPEWGALFSSDASNGLYCYPSGGNRVSYYYSASDHFNNTALKLNSWYHVAVVNNGGSVTFYLNGVADGTAASALAYSATMIGNDPGYEYFPGRIDDLRVYNRALPATEVLSLYKSGAAKIGLTDLSPGTLKNGLTGHWTFDGKDMVSNVADVSGSGNNGTLTGFTATTTAIGKLGQALRFDGTNDSVNTNSIVTNFFSAADGTISVWVRPRGVAADVLSTGIYVAPPAVSSSGIFASFGIVRANNTTLGQDRIWAFNYDGSMDSVGTTYNVDEWAHITWVHTGNVLSIYKNGEFIDSTASGNSSFFTGNLQIGTNWSGNQGWWNGDIDDVRTWNRALTASEIKQVHNIGAGQKVSTTKTPVGTLQSGLTGHWTFDGKDMYSNVADVSGNGRNLYLTNFISTSTAIGKIGQALTFDGVNDYVGNSSINQADVLTAGEGSISVWIKPTGNAPSSPLVYNLEYIVSLGQNIFSIIGINRGNLNGAGDKIWAYNEDTFGGFDSVGTEYSVDEWTHIVLVHSGGTLSIYKDGQFVDSTPSGDTFDFDNNGFFLGKPLSASNEYRGDMDDVRIWNRALSATEVKQLYNLGK